MEPKMRNAIEGLINPGGDGKTIVSAGWDKDALKLIRHGWVTPRGDGIKARCGGPDKCEHCMEEFRALSHAERDDWHARTSKERIEEKRLSQYTDGYTPGDDRDLFPDDKDDGYRADLDEIEEWKQKLVLCNVHERRFADLKSYMSSWLGGRQKHYKKMAAALADAIRFKSSLHLEQAFKKDWERELAQIKPLDNLAESVDLWSTKYHEENAE